ncbi:thiamine pyrophosphate-dependent enzyme [Hymenobacter sp. BRD67]|uniref:thiamine pyrophosphate-dependent enzyme n=1 Tax=Hymenobacter sp. BRD67 TaxID=2675877 RepID=UPI00293BD598|nr:thiamine pyrophosphate-dependent enzyme [Hymenobacter sp. BRD67]
MQVNVPLREPFYPKAGEEVVYEQDVKIIRDDHSHYALPPAEILELREHLRTAGRVVVVVGQQAASPGLAAALDEFAAARQAAVVADVISNLSDVRRTVQRQDIFLAGLPKAQQAALQPDLLITFGQSLISKSLKLFLRDAAPSQHWHLQASGEAADTFRRLTRIIRVQPATFFQQLLVLKTADYNGSGGSNPSFSAVADETAPSNVPSGAAAWQRADAEAASFLARFFSASGQPFNEFSAFNYALAALPEHTALHLANSMAVRYANILGLPAGRQIEVFANRGTSGIDGCTSTAVGAALAQPERPVVLLTGDVAFFYDRNAFWHNYPTPNLRVVLFNNHGGGIFRIIDGPRQQPELDEFFETTQALTAENLCRDFSLRYFPVSSFDELNAALPVFFAAESGAAVLEIFTDSKTNAAFFEEYRAAVKQAFS